MVRKLIKKPRTKSIKWRIRRKNSSSTNSNTVITTLHDSFLSCHRCITRIFSKPTKGSEKINALTFQSNENDFLIQPTTTFGSLRSLSLRLPPPRNPDTRTVFLDLDETLIHSTQDTPPKRYDFVVRPVINGVTVKFYVLKRPGVDELLDFLGKRFEIVLFTAGLKEYASLVVDILDRNRVISHRLYRDSCKSMYGNYVKDLSETGRDLSKVVIVDDNPSTFLLQPENALQMKPFVDDLEDREVWRLIKFFNGCREFEDFRDAIRFLAPFGRQNVAWFLYCPPAAATMDEKNCYF